MRFALTVEFSGHYWLPQVVQEVAASSPKAELSRGSRRQLQPFPPRKGNALQETDPILAVKRWLALSALTTGPVWRGIDRWGNLSSERLSTRGVTRAIRRAVARTEMDPEHLSSHSLRAGFATSAAAAGASERSIAPQTRHRSMATLRRYIRLATAFDDNAVDWVGL